MARLLDALESGEDVGHYGQFTFAAVAHHFMDEDAVIGLLAKQPDMDEEKARAVVLQIEERDYNPPRANGFWNSRRIRNSRLSRTRTTRTAATCTAN